MVIGDHIQEMVIGEMDWLYYHRDMWDIDKDQGLRSQFGVLDYNQKRGA